ncbi:MAG: response regulator [Alphaproteobacteria bacterium]|nr:MAG: response regulator [Alphaproteobacteria bacterium]
MSNVLIIEDDVMLAEDLKFFIEEEKHTCHVYNKADDVMKNINNLGQFNWAILDIMMLKGEIIKDTNPEIETGEIIYENIRRLFPHIKVLVLSAKDFNDMYINFNKEPNVIIMQKPVTDKKLKTILETISKDYI